LVLDATPELRTITIEKGYIYGCNTINIAYYRPDLYKISIYDNRVKNFKLPGYLYMSSNLNENNVLLNKEYSFPSCWIIYNDGYHMIFPNINSDAMGRIGFLNFKMQLSQFELLESERFNHKYLSMYLNGAQFYSPLRFLYSSPFAAPQLGKIIQENKGDFNLRQQIIWYDFVSTNNKLSIISRVKAPSPNWNVSSDHITYLWTLTADDVKYAQCPLVVPEKFIPIRAMTIPEKFKILTDNDAQLWQNDNSPSFYVWGKSKDDDSLQLAMFYYDQTQKQYNARLQKVAQMPEIILYNNDSQYVMLLYKKYSNESQDFKDEMLNLVSYLKKEKLLKAYPKPIEKKKTETKAVSPSVKSKPSARGFLDPLPPDELARRKAEFLASQPLELLFSKTEQAELFKEPNYSSINDSYQLAMAYDWYGKFSEARKALETAAPVKLAAKFVLGCYYPKSRLIATLNR